MTRWPRRHWSLAVMTAVLLLAAFLRFYRLDFQSFWNDEGNSARLSERSISLIIEGTASDIHPPLYYLLLHGWRALAGDSEFGLRSMSTIFGILLVASVYPLGRKLLGPGSRPVAILAAFAAAVSPSLVYYSQETRMYALMALLTILSSLLLIRLLKDASHRITLSLLYGLCLAAGLYTHYFFPVFMLVQLLFLAVWLLTQKDQFPTDRFRVLLAAAASFAMAILLYLPWIPIFIRQVTGREAQRPTLLNFSSDTWEWLILGGFYEGKGNPWILILLAILLLLGAVLLALRADGGWGKSLILLMFVAVPVAGMWLLGSTSPSFYKFLLMVIPWTAILLAAGLWLTWEWLRVRFIPIIGLIFVIGIGFLFLRSQGSALTNMFVNPDFARADYRGIVERIAMAGHPEAAVILNAANQWEVFTYYFPEDGQTPVIPLPKGHPDPGEVARELTEITSEHSRIYALFWGESERDPQRLVERWLDENAFKAADEWVGDVRFVTYAVPGAEISAPGSDVNLHFGSNIALKRYIIGTQSLIPGDILPVTLYWQGESAIDERYKVFLHLIDNKGQIITQRDSEPGGGLALTTTWPPGKVIVDNYGLLLPAEIEPGEYTLLIGMYPLGAPADRIIISSDTGQVDAYPLSVFQSP